jgi:hypothetical protein
MSFGYNFQRLTSRQGLLEAIGIDELTFQEVMDFVPPPKAPDIAIDKPVEILDIPPFLRHDIPKRNRSRGYRTVWQPSRTLSAYKSLARKLDNYFRRTLPGYPDDAAYGYRAGRNIRENAHVHRGKRRLLSVDIESFFPSIGVKAVEALLLSTGLSPEIADLLARFVTIGGSLPLGLPTSPTISNAIAVPIDKALVGLAARFGSTYTRYSDDLSFSSDDTLPDIETIGEVLRKFGFRVAEAKTRTSEIGQSHYVTGLSVSDPLQPHVPRGKKRTLRQELYYATKFGLDDHFRHRGVNDSEIVQQEVNRLDGTVKFVAHHEPRLATSIKTQWRSALNESGMKTSFTPRGLRNAPFFLFVDEAEYRRDGRVTLALCITMTQHFDKVLDDTRQLFARVVDDLWLDGDVETLRARGLHFTDCTEDVRLAYVKELSRMPLEGFVAYAECTGPHAYEHTYLTLLSALIVRRLMAAESQYAHMYFEQNSKVSTAKVRHCVENALAGLKATNNRRPAAVLVDFIAKPHHALSPPDFLLGVLGRYLTSKAPAPGKPEGRDRLMFERLRDKYRLILDVPAGIEFSRRRPIAPWGGGSAIGAGQDGRHQNGASPR